MADWRKVLAMTQRMTFLLLSVGITPVDSPMFREASTARDIISTVMSSRLLLVSMAMERAERKPATGALSLSFLLPRRRIRQSTSLYDELRSIRKSPK